jgi:sugar O-acyltransferase (sialic acid O-acetyltransferase NeuD family)
MARRRIAVLGAGGFAREVRWLIEDIDRTSSNLEFVGYIVKNMSALSAGDDREAVVGDEEWLMSGNGRVEALAIGIGNPRARLAVADKMLKAFPRDRWPALVHPGVQLQRSSATIGPGSIVCAGTIGTVKIRVEEFAMVNLLCTLGHECVIGRGSAINPTVSISGGVVVGEGVLVGTGSQILEGIHVGNRSTVGAGSVVTRNVDEGTTVVGVPAKVMAPSIGKK